MSWELFTRIVDQVPDMKRAVLHGVGEPMLVKNLPEWSAISRTAAPMCCSTPTAPAQRQERPRADRGRARRIARVARRGQRRNPTVPSAARIISTASCKNVRAFRDLQEREGADRPRVSAWLTGLKETIAELPAFVKVAAEIGVKEVYLQRLVFFEDDAIGHARPDQALYERIAEENR